MVHGSWFNVYSLTNLSLVTILPDDDESRHKFDSLKKRNLENMRKTSLGLLQLFKLGSALLRLNEQQSSLDIR
jgi:hypothetical protein